MRPTGRRPSRPAPETAILFDIDGTLLLSAGAGRRAFERAFAGWLGGRVDLSGYDYMGRTDLEIFRAMARLAGVPHPGEETARAVLDTYARLLPEELSAGPPGHVCPGVRALLEHLERDPLRAVGLLTGNYAPAAEVKLRFFGLDRFFVPPWRTSPEAPAGAPRIWGAFGGDEEDRRRLVPVALARLRGLSGAQIAPGRTVVIGDTERDIACARAAGAKALAVATGFRKKEELRAAGPDALLEDLSDLPAVMATLESLS